MAGAPSGAYERVLLSLSYVVSGNALSAATDQYIFVKPGNAENDVVPAASGDCPMGVSLETNKDNGSIVCALVGVSKIRLAGTVKRGNLLKVNTGTTDGRAIRSGHDTPYGGMALQDGVSGDVIAMLLTIGIGT